MHNNKKRAAILPGIVMSCLMLLCATSAHAQLNITTQADIAFGIIDFSAPTAVGDITLGTNGNVTYGTTTSGGGVGTPGQILLDAPEGTTLSIACSGGTLANPGGATLPIDPVTFVLGTTNVGPYGSGTVCAGLGTSVATHTLTTVATQNTIVIGGTLAINGQPVGGGTYNGTNLGASQPSFRMLVQ